MTSTILNTECLLAFSMFCDFPSYPLLIFLRHLSLFSICKTFLHTNDINSVLYLAIFLNFSSAFNFFKIIH